MRWRRSSTSQVTDRRGSGGFGGMGGLGGLGGGSGGGIPIPMGGGIGGIIVLVIFLAVAFLGGGSGFLGGGGGTGDDSASSLDPNDEMAQFVNAVTVDIQKFWEEEFQRNGKDYQEVTLVLFSDATGTGCGQASSATGPFYCPVDEHVYLDASFFTELSNRFGAPGDFAQAYVIAHEFGHHVEDELGTIDQVNNAQQQNPDQANELSVRLELMADCYAGLWAHDVNTNPDNDDVQSITQEDVNEGLAAAAAVGDDRIQQSTTGRIDPESFTHGTSEQRMHWFTVGFETGDINACDTFNAASLDG